MLTYLAKRVFLMIPTLIGITLITYFIIRLSPGSPLMMKLHGAEGLKAEGTSVAHYQEFEKLYELDTDLPAWYEAGIVKINQRVFHVSAPDDKNMFRSVAETVGKNTLLYGKWLQRILKLDFGTSLKDSNQVRDKILAALPITLTLNLIEIFIVYFISVPLGVWSALKRDSLLDRTVTVQLLILYSLPTFWVAMLLMMLFSSADFFNWFPMVGYQSDGAEHLIWYRWLADVAWHLVLPVICMVYGSFAFLSRFTRVNMLEVLKQDYIRTARAKGLRENTVIWKHGFRNALIPLVTLMGTLLPALLSGSVIIEQIFSIPGMGKLGFEAVISRDYPTIMALTSIQALLTLLSLLLTDLIYAWVDPRIAYEG